jgi:hypothetical protein
MLRDETMDFVRLNKQAGINQAPKVHYADRYHYGVRCNPRQMRCSPKKGLVSINTFDAFTCPFIVSIIIFIDGRISLDVSLLRDPKFAAVLS